MPLKPEYDGDAMKAPGAFLAVSKNKKTDEVLGLYVICDEGNFIRGNGLWITATGKALYQLHGSQLIPMDPAFIDTFDEMDKTGRKPTDDEITDGSKVTATA